MQETSPANIKSIPRLSLLLPKDFVLDSHALHMVNVEYHPFR